MIKKNKPIEFTRRTFTLNITTFVVNCVINYLLCVYITHMIQLIVKVLDLLLTSLVKKVCEKKTYYRRYINKCSKIQVYLPTQ